MDDTQDSPADPAPGAAPDEGAPILSNADEAASAGDTHDLVAQEPVAHDPADPDAVGDFTDAPDGFPDLDPVADADGPGDLDDEDPGEQDPAPVSGDGDVPAGQTGEQADE